MEANNKLRNEIIDHDKFIPNKCKQECKQACPINKTGKLCIEVTPASSVCFISESLCIGCGICVKRCHFDAIKIINFPKGLTNEVIHRHGPKAFKLHRLPQPRAGEVLGLLRSNGTGKSTALIILNGSIKPNLGRCENPPEWKEILKFFRGSELQNYFTNMLEKNLKSQIKIQYVDSVAKSKAAQSIVGKRLKIVDQRDKLAEIIDKLDLESILEREIKQLSGGELQ
ncbi:abc transporter e family member 2-like [Stylonychia lemnae]|uniref:Abc transporter e family member 2-like n=1 Tax=Stylonychia lemnae TaxID=5949 RepID=A0A077ZWG9_STYLE|nr:abc transporter e family member 2-like [Stylonychia lemnae]|eukprot:CDW73936.1 abc transporter e family member 2-like [Stylonychia lemnae]